MLFKSLLIPFHMLTPLKQHDADQLSLDKKECVGRWICLLF